MWTLVAPQVRKCSFFFNKLYRDHIESYLSELSYSELVQGQLEKMAFSLVDPLNFCLYFHSVLIKNLLRQTIYYMKALVLLFHMVFSIFHVRFFFAEKHRFEKKLNSIWRGAKPPVLSNWGNLLGKMWEAEVSHQSHRKKMFILTPNSPQNDHHHRRWKNKIEQLAAIAFFAVLPSDCQSVHLSVRPSIHPSIHPFVRLSVLSCPWK